MPIKGNPESTKTGVKHRGHPLFPLDPEKHQNQGEIAWIYVRRGGVTAPKIFSAEELIDEEQLYEQFGGGSYELKAKDRDKRQWTASALLTLAGAPKPLAPPSVPEREPSSMDGSPFPAWLTQILPVGGALISAILTPFANAQKEAATAHAESLKVLAGVLGGRSNDAFNSKLLELAVARGSGEGSPDKVLDGVLTALQAGMELQAGLSERTAAREGEGGESILKEIKEGFLAFSALNAQKAARAAAVPAVPAVPAAPAAPAAPAVPAASAHNPEALFFSFLRSKYGPTAEGASDRELVEAYARELRPEEQ